MRMYERIAPEGPCVSPEGHEAIELVTLDSPVPRAIICPNCGKAWAIFDFTGPWAVTR